MPETPLAENPPPAQGAAIIRAVAARRGVPAHRLYAPDMTDPIVAARREAMARIRLDLGWSYQRIGALFARHHTTVLHHVRTYFEKGGA